MMHARILTRSSTRRADVTELRDVVDAHVDDQHVTVKLRNGDRVTFASRIVTNVEFLGGP